MTKQIAEHYVYALFSSNGPFTRQNKEPFATYMDALTFRSTFKPGQQAYIQTIFAPVEVTPETIIKAESDWRDENDEGNAAIKDYATVKAARAAKAEAIIIGAKTVPDAMADLIAENNKLKDTILTLGEDLEDAHGRLREADEDLAREKLRYNVAVSLRGGRAVEGESRDHCITCNTKLDQADQPLTRNCGDYCWSCVGEAEYDGMSPEQKHEFDNLRWPTEDWRHEVANDSTKMGYVAWRRNQIGMWLNERGTD